MSTTQEVIRSVWRKKFKAALSLIDKDSVEVKDGLSINIDPIILSHSLIFYGDLLEELIESKRNIDPPSISVLEDESVEFVFKSDPIRDRNIAKLFLVFKKQGKYYTVNYRSLHTEPILKGVFDYSSDSYEEFLDLILTVCLFNMEK